MATMSFGVVVEYAVTHWESLTMGVRGISVPPPCLFRLFPSPIFYAFLPDTLRCLLSRAAAKNLLRTRVGTAFVAIRDRDVAAEVIGVDLTKYKVMAFASVPSTAV